MPSDDDWTKGYALSLTNKGLAEILEFRSFYHDAEIAVVARREAAKRLRAQPEPHYVLAPGPKLPTLKAYAAIEPETQAKSSNAERACPGNAGRGAQAGPGAPKKRLRHPVSLPHARHLRPPTRPVAKGAALALQA
jgi:hypothetical protein